MKKLRLLQIINILLVIALVMTLLLLKFVFVNIDFNKFWYIVVMAYYSVMMLLKYLILGKDNMLWFAIVLILCAIYVLLYNIEIISLKTYPVILIFPSVSSLLLFAIYKNILHLFISILFLFVGLPLFLVSYGIVQIWWFILIELILVCIAIVLINFIYSIYKR